MALDFRLVFWIFTHNIYFGMYVLILAHCITFIHGVLDEISLITYICLHTVLPINLQCFYPSYAIHHQNEMTSGSIF